jgi:hypothetical protein
VLSVDRSCGHDEAAAHDSQGGDQPLRWFLQPGEVRAVRLLGHPLLVGADRIVLLTHHGPLVKSGDLHAVRAAAKLSWYRYGPADLPVSHRAQRVLIQCAFESHRGDHNTRSQMWRIDPVDHG